MSNLDFQIFSTSSGFSVEMVLVGERPTVRTQNKTSQNKSKTCGIPNVCTSIRNQTHKIIVSQNNEGTKKIHT